MKSTKKNKHLTFDDRIEIQECLSKGMTFKAIAKRIGKDPTTVSKEVKRRAVVQESGFTKTQDKCPRLMRSPFVCNGCERSSRASCAYPRLKYVARLAQEEYETVLKESREGVFLNKEEFYKNDEAITDAVRNGQHIYHAIKTKGVSVSKSSVYRYINKGYFTVKPIDLPRAVKFKQRAVKREDYVSANVRKGRQYQDFLDYMGNNIGTAYQKMDTVIGRIGGKVIMTFQFINQDFMFGLLLDNKSALEATRKVSDLKRRLASAVVAFGDVFPVLLTDNGGEFNNASAFETDLLGNVETRLFFCDPYASYQKPHAENNHTLFRMIAPKGTSFDDFTQDTVNTIFSHVNAVKRKHLNGKSAYELFCFTYSSEIASILGISCVDPQDVMQSPKLLNKILHK